MVSWLMFTSVYILTNLLKERNMQIFSKTGTDVVISSDLPCS